MDGVVIPPQSFFLNMLCLRISRYVVFNTYGMFIVIITLLTVLRLMRF